MKTSWMHRTLPVLLLSALALAGCGKAKAPEPPLEELKLLDRLCNNMRKGYYDQALAILDKLDALSPEDAVLAEMRLRLISNACVQAAQNALDRGDPEAALRLTQNAIKNNSAIPRLKVMEEELQGVIALRDAARRLAAAETPAELAAALKAIEPLAAAHPEAKQLAEDIKIRRGDLAKMRSEEAAKAAARAAGTAPPAANAPSAEPALPAPSSKPAAESAPEVKP